MKRLTNILLALSMIMVCFSANAQDANYKAKVKQLMSASGDLKTLLAESNINNYATIAKNTVPALTEQRAHQLASKYMNTQMMDVCADLFAPIYYEQCTTDDLDKVIKFYKTPKGQRIAECNAKLQTPEIQQMTSTVIQEGLYAIIYNVEPKHVTCEAPASYMEKFNQLNKCLNLEKRCELVMQSLTPIFSQLPDGDKILEKTIKYLKDEYIGIYGSMFYKVYTEEDLDTLIAFCNTPEGWKMQSLGNTISAKFLQYGVNIVSDFQEWIKRQ